MPVFFASFTGLDWAVLLVYFAVVLSLGSIIAWLRHVRGSADYFLASRSMPTWVVAISILSTAQSGATFIGAPGQSFAGNLTYLSSNLGQVLAAIILAVCFIPVYYAAGVTTPYELLEVRFGRSARLATSIMYLIGRIFASGSRVFIGALPMSLVVFGDTERGHMLASIGIVAAIGTVYALAGGIRSVIWTDLLQVGVYLGSALIAIALLLGNINASPSEILRALGEPGPDGTSKLTLFRTGFSTSSGYDFGQEYTVVTALVGFCLLGLASYGMDQDLVQRMLTCKSARKGAWSVISGVLVGIPAVAIFLSIGLLLHIYYQRPDLTGTARTYDGSEKVFLRFILDGVPSGLTGLMIAGLFAAGMAPLTSMSSAFVSDIYRPLRPGLSDGHYLRMGRGGVIAFGVLLGLFAVVCIDWYDPKRSTLIDFALSVMAFAYAGLLGVFLTAMFTRRGNSGSAIAALVGGFISVVLLEPVLYDSWIAWFGLDPAASRIAFPWRLTIGAAVSTGICASGRPHTPRRLTESTGGA